MSSEYYFKKWRNVLAHLETIVNIDIDYQTKKAHDKQRCDAAMRLSSVLGQYMTIYNHIIECLHQNLQVQKAGYIEETVKAVVGRILELKHTLIKLDGSEYQFLSNGLIFNKLTTCDAEMSEVPRKEERPEQIQRMIDEVMERVNERKRQIEKQKMIEEHGVEEEQTQNWWDEELNDANDEEEYTIEEKKEELTEEQKEIKRNIELIQAHEKTRQVITWLTQKNNKRQRWTKELEGTAVPQAPYKTRENSAAIIQKVCRAYFECKRQKHLECKRDELLGLKQCIKPKMEAQLKHAEINVVRPKMKGKFEEEWKSNYEKVKEKYLKQKGDEISEAYRDHIRDWFYKWYEDIKLFHDIPDVRSGGSKLILREELPTPEEYLEEYKAYLANKKANKNKSALQRRAEKMAAQKEQAMAKREKQQNKKLQKESKIKMLKNPTQHPGFDFPESMKTEHIIKAINDYHNDWDEFDKTELLEVKEQHCKEVDRKNAFMEVKMDVIPKVDEDMRIELKKLKAALKKDYETNEEKMPEPMKKRRKREKKKNILKTTISDNLAEKMENLVFQGFIKEYPKTKLKEFIGDPNFAGDDIRCDYRSALPLHGEMRSMWWEKCQNLVNGFHRILLVGPKSSGKTLLLHALASLNDAILFELDINQIGSELASDVYLQQIVQHVVSCAKATQPSVIHIKHVHRLYYKKVPKQEAAINLELFKRHFTKKLFKKIHKTDKITIIGSCIDPWMTKSRQMLKQFPNVVILPNTNYSTVVQMLNEWVLSNHVIPSDLNVSCLAHVLQGYSFDCLKNFLEKFLSAERITWISSHGLSPKDVYDSILDSNEEKVDFSKYHKWYSDRTVWGKLEKKHLREQKEFKHALERWALKMEMEKRKTAPKTTASTT